MELETIVLRLTCASLFSMAVGFERERKGKAAGLKTHMLVGIGAAAYFLIFIEFTLGPLKDAESISPEPMRIIEGVVAGIGFLGAGAIIRAGGQDVHGLTTGAGIWVSGGIGLACGGGYFVLAGMIAAFTLVILLGVGWLERRYIEPRAN